MIEEMCGGCRFWKPLESGETVNCQKRGRVPLGYCRRNPPILSEAVVRHEAATSEIDDHMMFIATRFPVVVDDDWCGRFKSNAEHSSACVREYRIDREVTALCDAVGRVITVESTDGPGSAEHARKVLTDLDDRLLREVPHLVGEIRERAKALATSDTARDLINWATLDNALAEASGAKVPA